MNFLTPSPTSVTVCHTFNNPLEKDVPYSFTPPPSSLYSLLKKIDLKKIKKLFLSPLGLKNAAKTEKN